MMSSRQAILFASLTSVALLAQATPQPDWAKLEAETMQHYQAVLRLDTRNPPGNEHIVAEYVKQVLEKEGIPAQIVGSDPKRSNVVARLKGSGRKRPLLIMGHSDVVTVDEARWKFPPLSATRDGGYVYGRGTVDDKDNLTASLMTMLLLKRLNRRWRAMSFSSPRRARKGIRTSAFSTWSVSTFPRLKRNTVSLKAAACRASMAR